MGRLILRVKILLRCIETRRFPTSATTMSAMKPDWNLLKMKRMKQPSPKYADNIWQDTEPRQEFQKMDFLHIMRYAHLLKPALFRK